MTTPAEDTDPTDGWDAASFGAPGGQLSRAVTELDTVIPDDSLGDE